MKILKYFNYILLPCLLLYAAGCEKAYDPYPEFETVPHGFGAYKAGTPTSMFFGNNESKLEGTLQWITTDGKVTVKEMDLYVTWSEGYLDKDGLPKTAVHGRKKLKSISSVPAARTPVAFSFSAKEVYEVFKSAKYDYSDDIGSRDVFSNPKDSRRTATSYFTPNDKFVLSWGFKGEDGRYFDTWSPGICNNSVGANCSLNFGIICQSALAGTYTAVAIGTSTDGCCPTETMTTTDVTLKDLGSGKYELSDWSGGLYKEWYDVYGIDDAYVSEPDKTKNKLIIDIQDACNNISAKGVEPFDEAIELTGAAFPSEGKIQYSWENGYGDKGTVVLTKK